MDANTITAAAEPTRYQIALGVLYTSTTARAGQDVGAGDDCRAAFLQRTRTNLARPVRARRSRRTRWSGTDGRRRRPPRRRCCHRVCGCDRRDARVLSGDRDTRRPASSRQHQRPEDASRPRGRIRPGRSAGHLRGTSGGDVRGAAAAREYGRRRHRRKDRSGRGVLRARDHQLGAAPAAACTGRHAACANRHPAAHPECTGRPTPPDPVPSDRSGHRGAGLRRARRRPSGRCHSLCRQMQFRTGNLEDPPPARLSLRGGVESRVGGAHPDRR